MRAHPCKPRRHQVSRGAFMLAGVHLAALQAVTLWWHSRME